MRNSGAIPCVNAPPVQVPWGFDDFLRLGARDFSRHGLVVFAGCSGSGKSTAIEWLLREHRDFTARETQRIEGPPLALPRDPAEVVVVDEIVSMRDLPLVARLVLRGARLLVATHLRPLCFRAFHSVARTAVFTTDTDRAKIERHLARIGVPATADAVDEYVRRFGANYTDINIILERHPAPTFDAALARFTRFCTLTKS